MSSLVLLVIAGFLYDTMKMNRALSKMSRQMSARKLRSIFIILGREFELVDSLLCCVRFVIVVNAIVAYRSEKEEEEALSVLFSSACKIGKLFTNSA